MSKGIQSEQLRSQNADLPSSGLSSREPVSGTSRFFRHRIFSSDQDGAAVFSSSYEQEASDTVSELEKLILSTRTEEDDIFPEEEHSALPEAEPAPEPLAPVELTMEAFTAEADDELTAEPDNIITLEDIVFPKEAIPPELEEATYSVRSTAAPSSARTSNREFDADRFLMSIQDEIGGIVEKALDHSISSVRDKIEMEIMMKVEQLLEKELSGRSR